MMFLFFKGSHTGFRIKDTVDAILVEYEIISKVKYIISDNASNMAKAFKVQIAVEDIESSDSEEEIDIAPDVQIDANVFEDYEHIRCFAHSLQLVIKDGLKESRQMSTTLSKCAKLSALIHKSTKFKVNKII